MTAKSTQPHLVDKIIDWIGISKNEISEEDFKNIYLKHQGMVRAVIYQMAGKSALDDLVQETFLNIWKSLPLFRQESSLKTWIYKIATNVALEYLRKNRNKTLHENQHSNEDKEMSYTDTELQNKDLIEKGLSYLTVDHKAILVLAYLHELTVQEISDILNIPLGTVKSRLHHAKNEFKNAISSMEKK